VLLPEDPELAPLPPVVCPFMLAAAASKTADVNANVLFFMLRFRFLFSLIKEFTVSPSTRRKLARRIRNVY